MALGYDGKLYILAFDHRGSFQKKMFGIEGDPTEEETKTISDAKRLIFEGMEKAVERGVDAASAGVLVDEQFGSDIPQLAHEHGLSLTMPVEKSGQNEFDFQYGDEFGDHIAKYDLLASKVLVRYNPDGDKEMNERQSSGSSGSPTGCNENDRKFLFELLVPAEDSQLEEVGGDTDRYDAELRPELMRRAIEALQDYGIEVDIWKIEGVDRREDAEMLSEQARKGEGRENVKSVLLGRGASDDKVDHWLREAAGVEGFIGFAIGRSIWWDALKGYLDDEPRARGRRRADRRQLPALHQGLRRGGVLRQGLSAAARAPRDPGVDRRVRDGVRHGGRHRAVEHARDDVLRRRGRTPGSRPRSRARRRASSPRRSPRARTSSAPLKIPGNASTLLIWFG